MLQHTNTNGGETLSAGGTGDVVLPSIDSHLAKVEQTGQRLIGFAILGAGLTCALCSETLWVWLAAIVPSDNFVSQATAGPTARLISIALIVFVTMFAGFAILLPRYNDVLREFLDRFDTVVAIARQVTLADGIGNDARRRVASDTLWQAKVLRKKSRQQLVARAAIAILWSAAPWAVILGITLRADDNATLSFVATMVLGVKLILILKIVGAR